MDIATKSTGQLIDEWITTQFKLEVKPNAETINRHGDLEAIIIKRVGDRMELIDHHIQKLRIVLRQCWNAQETVMKYHKLKIPDRLDSWVTMNDWITLGQAGITAQKTNAQRNAIIRDIDTILLESSITPLDKTY